MTSTAYMFDKTAMHVLEICACVRACVFVCVLAFKHNCSKHTQVILFLLKMPKLIPTKQHLQEAYFNSLLVKKRIQLINNRFDDLAIKVGYKERQDAPKNLKIHS